MLQAALQNIWEQRFDTRTEIDAQLFDEISRVINSATDEGISDSEVGGDFMEQLRTNNEVFAAFKTHRMGRDMASQLIDEKGRLKSFQQFRQDVAPIASHHVNAWLQTEYDTAVKRAHHAAEMRQFADEADVLPNIEWLPSTAVNPRESHMPFYHRIWPMNDPFWNDHKPGDEWGCQCDWRSTDQAPTDNRGIGGGQIIPSPGLKGNPAQTGRIFSDDHPYFPSSCASCPFKGTQLSLFTNRKKDCYACTNVVRTIQQTRKAQTVQLFKQLKKAPNYTAVKYDKKSGGLSAIHKDHNFDEFVGKYGIPRGDYEKITTDTLRKNGHTVILGSEKKKTGKSVSDGWLDHVKMDIKAIEGTGKWTIKNKFTKACEQEAACVVLYFHDPALYSLERVRQGWEYYIVDLHGRTQTIKKILCVVDKEITEFVP